MVNRFEIVIAILEMINLKKNRISVTKRRPQICVDYEYDFSTRKRRSIRNEWNSRGRRRSWRRLASTLHGPGNLPIGQKMFVNCDKILFILPRVQIQNTISTYRLSAAIGIEFQKQNNKSDRFAAKCITMIGKVITQRLSTPKFSFWTI